MHNLGFLVRTLGASQEAFQLVKNANHAITEDNNIIVFSETPNMPCIQPNFCNMQLAEAWGYKHPLIATRLVLAKKLLSFPGTQEKYFYIWDLEWLRYPSQIKNYNAFAGIYRNPKLKLIARSKSHKDIIEDCWNVLVTGIVEDYNINQFIEIINAERNRQGLLAA
jgi:hypothetical protein